MGRGKLVSSSRGRGEGSHLDAGALPPLVKPKLDTKWLYVAGGARTYQVKYFMLKQNT